MADLCHELGHHPPSDVSASVRGKYRAAIAALVDYLTSLFNCPTDKADIRFFSDRLMDEHGIRIYEITIYRKTENGISGASFSRNDPRCARLILHCEEFLMFHGSEDKIGKSLFMTAETHIRHFFFGGK